MRVLNIEKEKTSLFLYAYTTILLCPEIPNDSIKNIKTNKRIGRVIEYKINI